MLRPDEGTTPPKSPVEDQLPLWDADEIRARYALHQSGACLGESVRISEESNGVNILRIGSSASYPVGTRLETVLNALAELRDAGPPHDGSMALRHAWALRNLASELRTRRLRGLSSESLDLLETMVRDHLSGIRSSLRELGVQPAAAAKSTTGTDWRNAASPLFDALSLAGTDPTANSSIQRHLEEFSRGFDLEIKRARKAPLESGASR
jgi:hypothetical protein